MGINMIVTGLEEYEKELDKLHQLILEAHQQVYKMLNLTSGLNPKVEIKRAPTEAGDKTTAE